jgi:hypothetical protein
MAWSDTLIAVNDSLDGDYKDPYDGEYYILMPNGNYMAANDMKEYNSNGDEIVTSNTIVIQQGGNGGSIWDALLGGIKTYVTDQSVINQALGSLTGFNVRDRQNPPIVNPNTGGVTPPKKSNTVWYIVGGILVLGGIITTVILINKKK